MGTNSKIGGIWEPVRRVAPGAGVLLCAIAVMGCPSETRRVGTAVCLQCHDGFLAPDQSHFVESAHFADDVACEDCHGGGFLHVRNGGRAGLFIDSLKNQPFAEVHLLCGECHELQTQTYLRSGHFARGLVTCLDCHNVHTATALTALVEDNSLCLQCHRQLEFPDDEVVDFHTGPMHPVDPTGSGASRCAPCHMPPLVQHPERLGPRDHSLFTVPPTFTLDAAARGEFPVPPNSCAGVRGCHHATFTDSGPPRNVNDLELVESLIPLYEMVGGLPPLPEEEKDALIAEWFGADSQ